MGCSASDPAPVIFEFRPSNLVKPALQQARFGRQDTIALIGAWLRRSSKIALGHSRARQRGDLRIIYYLRTQHGPIWMLTLYPKNVAENIPAGVLRKIKDEVDD